MSKQKLVAQIFQTPPIDVIILRFQSVDILKETA